MEFKIACISVNLTSKILLENTLMRFKNQKCFPGQPFTLYSAHTTPPSHESVRQTMPLWSGFT